jgi:hypothetical protein
MIGMKLIDTTDTQTSLKSTESERSEAAREVGVTDAPLEMAEIVRVFNSEKKARGWEKKSVSAAKTRTADTGEVVGVKPDAGVDSRKAEVKALAAYGFESERVATAKF